MKFYSDDGKFYETLKDCEKADADYAKALEEKEKAKKLASEERSKMAREIEDARQELISAQKNYNELIEKFIKKYGSYHTTLSLNDDVDALISTFFRFI